MGTTLQLAGLSQLLNNETTRTVVIFLLILTTIVVAIGVYLEFSGKNYR